MEFMFECVLAIVVILVTGSSVIDRDMAKTMAFAAEFGHTSKAPVLLTKDSMVSGKSIQGSQGSNPGQSTGQNQSSGAGQGQTCMGEGLVLLASVFMSLSINAPKTLLGLELV